MKKIIIFANTFVLYLCCIHLAIATDNPSPNFKDDNSRLIEKTQSLPSEYAYVGLGEGDNTKLNHKDFKKDMYRYNPSTNTWNKINNFPGPDRSEAVCFISNNIAYAGCGQCLNKSKIGNQQVYNNQIYKYNSELDTWEEKKIFPQIFRKEMIVFTHKNEGYVGLGRFGAKKFYDIYKYLPFENKWFKALEYDSSLYPKFIISLNDNLYIGGEKEFYCLEPGADEWKQLSDIPMGSSGKVLFILKNKIYLGLGGITVEEKNIKKKKKRSSTKKYREKINSQIVYCYDTTKNTWTKVSSFPGKATLGFVSFKLEGKGYLGLGYDKKGKMYNSFFCYDPEKDVWYPIANLPTTSRKNSIAFVLKNRNNTL